VRSSPCNLALAPLTLLPSLTCPAEASAAACLGIGVAALVAARAATDLAADLPSAVAAAVSSACSASPSAAAEAGAYAETNQWLSAGFNAAHYGREVHCFYLLWPCLKHAN